MIIGGVIRLQWALNLLVKSVLPILEQSWVGYIMGASQSVKAYK